MWKKLHTFRTSEEVVQPIHERQNNFKSNSCGNSFATSGTSEVPCNGGP